jgi:hypothetical protein
MRTKEEIEEVIKQSENLKLSFVKISQSVDWDETNPLCIEMIIHYNSVINILKWVLT